MVYTNKMKQKLDAIFKVFESYIREHDYFDIVYSEKAGYVQFPVHKPNLFETRILDTPEEMLGVLFEDIMDDVVFSPDNPTQEHNSLLLTEYEEAESRRRVTAILETMEAEDKARYLNYIDAYIKKYQAEYARLQNPSKQRNDKWTK